MRGGNFRDGKRRHRLLFEESIEGFFHYALGKLGPAALFLAVTFSFFPLVVNLVKTAKKTAFDDHGYPPKKIKEGCQDSGRVPFRR